MQREIKFIVNAVRWFDKSAGNTYHSVNIEEIETGKHYVSGKMVYGYEEHYKQTTLEIMTDNNLLPGYNKKNAYLYERENNYPIIWNVSDGLKRDMINNVS
jgi:hypothetical protein